MSRKSKVTKGNTDDDLCLPFVYDIKRKHSYIKSKADMREFERVLQHAFLVGIDTERKPDFGVRDLKTNPTSLIQIAIRTTADTNFEEYCYIIDVFYMDESSFSHLNEMLTECFMNPNIIKLGQGIRNDVVELHRSYPAQSSFNRGVSFLDTNDMMKQLNPSQKGLVSLKDMVKKYLHADLIKTSQLSDWNQRPLSEEQQHYACCDAVALLRLYDSMAHVMITASKTNTGRGSSKKRHNQSSSSSSGGNDSKKRPRASSSVSVESMKSDCTVHSRSNSFDLDDSADMSKYSSFVEELGGNNGIDHGMRYRTRSNSLNSVSSMISDDDDYDNHGHHNDSNHTQVFKGSFFQFNLDEEEAAEEEQNGRSAPGNLSSPGTATVCSRFDKRPALWRHAYNSNRERPFIPEEPLKINKLGLTVNSGNKRHHVRSFDKPIPLLGATKTATTPSKHNDNDNGKAALSGAEKELEEAALALARQKRKTEKRLRQKLAKKENKETLCTTAVTVASSSSSD